MLPLWGVAVGLAAGWLRRGHLAQLARLPLQNLWLVFAGLILQLLIFPTPWSPEPLIGWATTPLHFVSYALIALFFVLNWRLASLWAMALGMVLNLTVIAANGGHMPARLEALRAAGQEEAVQALQLVPDHAYANVVLMDEHTRLNYLGDWLFLPSWVPLANAFSLGDLLLMVGVAWLIQAGMVRSALRVKSG